MDLPCVQWQNYVAQKWFGLDPKRRECFTSLLEVDDVFKFSLKTITEDDLDFVNSLSSAHSVQKDSEKAAACRERGNSSFKLRDYTVAALHYSQGLCFAPLSSEHVSLCYANRSAALYQLHFYQESLDDIDKALENNYPSHLLHKVEERRRQCLRCISVSEKAKEDHHNPASKHQGPERRGPLKFGINPPAAVAINTEKGRHLVATGRIAAGEVLLTDHPYSCVLIPGMEAEVRGKATTLEADSEEFGMQHRRCHRCLTETLRPLPCDGCSYSRYCSTTCKQNAWEEHHRWECPLGADLIVMGEMSQLALRVALKAGLRNIQNARNPIRNEDTDSKPVCPQTESNQSSPCHTAYHGDSYRTVFYLMHHLSNHSPCLRFLFAVTIATLYQMLMKVGPPPAAQEEEEEEEEEGGITGQGPELWLLGSAALRHILQLRCNAQAVSIHQDTGAVHSHVQAFQEMHIATAVFPTLSLLNHSCFPNSSLVFTTGLRSDPRFSDASAVFRKSIVEASTPCEVTATIRAAKDIRPGQEILHCYGPHTCRMGTRERQRHLQEQYFFLCQCEACTLQQEGSSEGGQQGSGAGGSLSESGLLCRKCKAPIKKSSDNKGGFICSQSRCGHHMPLSEVNLSLEKIRGDLATAVDLMERERPDEALKLLRRTQSQSGLILAETHPLQGELADDTARAYCAMGDWNNAASHLERSTVAIRSRYGEDSVELGYQLFKLAQLLFSGGSRGMALSVIPKAKHLLLLHGGLHSNQLKELQEMEDCLHRGQKS